MVEHYQNKGNQKNFAERYYCYNLIYYEYFADINQAIFREKEIKNMTHQKKLKLVNNSNPNWKFLRI
jgi:putative endonuclease